MTKSISSISLNNSKQNLGSFSNHQNNPQIIVKNTVDSIFAKNVIEQFNSLSQAFGNHDVQKLIILESADDAKDFGAICPNLSRRLNGDASIAYGVYDKKDKAICIVQSNHQRKDKKFEGNISEQGSDTLTHEFGHLIDRNYSNSDKFKKAYKKDLKNFAKNLRKNPFKRVANSDMTFAQASKYFEHYFEGADFSDGIDNRDVTRRGLREQWAESFSIALDDSENKANEIHKAIFGNSYKALCNILA